MSVLNLCRQLIYFECKKQFNCYGKRTRYMQIVGTAFFIFFVSILAIPQYKFRTCKSALEKEGYEIDGRSYQSIWLRYQGEIPISAIYIPALKFDEPGFTIVCSFNNRSGKFSSSEVFDGNYLEKINDSTFSPYNILRFF